jgi:TolB-like protein
VTRKAEALLAYLALGHDERHGRDKLAALLWGRQTDAQARHNLRQCLASLRKGLGAAARLVIDADPASITLRADAIEIDLGALRHLAKAQAQANATAALAEAAGLCKGELLAGLNLREEGFEDWLSLERQTARGLQVGVLTRYSESRLAEGDGEAAVAAAEQLARLELLDEPAQRLMMRAYAAAGRRSAALAHYQTSMALLEQELGIQPEAETTALRQTIKDGGGPRAEATTAAVEAVAAPLGAPNRPAIAVLPFTNISGDPEQEYFADGIVEDIITALSRYRWFPVVARNSTFTYKGRAVDILEAGRELGARYVAEGSVRKAGDKVRITVQLVDAESGNHIWAERYDCGLDAIFEVQDEIIEAIVAAIEPELGSAERERAKGKVPDNLDAWDCHHRGLWHLYRFTKESNARAQQLMRQAIRMDPDFGLSHAGLADALYMGVLHGYSDAPEQAISAAFEAAQAALVIDDKHAGAHFSLGRAYILKREHDAAIAELQTAVALNPSFADAYYGLSMALLYAGGPEESIVAMDHALRLSPHDPYHWIFLTLRAAALAIARRHDEAVENANEAARHPGAKLTAFAVQAGCLALVGRSGEARAALDKARQFKPNLSADYLGKIWPLKNRRDFDYFIDGLRDLGLPEHDGGVLNEASPA